jgi:hypothetical protein
MHDACEGDCVLAVMAPLVQAMGTVLAAGQ